MAKLSKRTLILDRVQQALVNGQRLNRADLADCGITENNKSLHSYISDLKNKRMIPVEDEWSCKNFNKDYFMKSEERKRFIDPGQRPIQKEEMRIKVEENRRLRQIKSLNKLIDKLERFPYVLPYFETAINDFISRFSVLIDKDKKGN